MGIQIAHTEQFKTPAKPVGVLFTRSAETGPPGGPGQLVAGASQRKSRRAELAGELQEESGMVIARGGWESRWSPELARMQCSGSPTSGGGGGGGAWCAIAATGTPTTTTGPPSPPELSNGLLLLQSCCNLRLSQESHRSQCSVVWLTHPI